MATSKTRSYYARPSYRFLPTDQPYQTADQVFEFDESDLYASAGPVRSGSPEIRRKLATTGRVAKKPTARPAATASASLPMNVPDWSKILREDYRDGRQRSGGRFDGDEDDGGSVESGDWFDAGGGRVPPHEFLARTRMASSSVHEGVGRTLKGRDLSRVRNAIFEKTGFQD